MRLLGALAAGVCAYLVVAQLTGHGGDISIRIPGRRRRVRINRAVWLRQAGVAVTPLQFWAVSFAIGVVVELVVWGIAGSPFVGVVPAVAAALGPRAYFARRRTERLGELVRSWPDGIRHVVATTMARGTVHQGLVELAASGPDRLAESFARYPAMARMAGSLAALEVIREELADPTSDQVIERLIVAQEKGQVLAMRVLKDLATSVTKDLKATEEVATAALEPRITARVTFIAPWIGLIILCAGNVAFADFYASSTGAVVIAFGAVLSMAGMAFVKALAREPVEARVLGAAARSVG